MTSVAIYNTSGGKVDQIDLSPVIFDAEISTHCVRAVVNTQMARRRQGTACTKTKGLVSGGGAKPWKQKGTGRACSGSSRSPLWRGGGTMFGPVPREYGGKINRKVTRKAILSCLASMAKDSDIIVLDQISFSEPKTKQVLEMLNNLKIDETRRVLILTDSTNLNLFLSARNIPQVDVINCDNLNVYDLTTHDVLITTPDAIKRIEETYA